MFQFWVGITIILSLNLYRYYSFFLSCGRRGANCQLQYRQILQRVRGFCTDCGTEMGVAEVSGCTVEDILPPWMLSCYDLEIHDADACLDMNSGAAALAEGNSSFYVFPEAVISPGTLHICHNMVSEVDQSLEHFSEWLPGFKAIVHFLHTDSLRQRFVGSCLLGTHLEFLKHQVVKLMKPALWRWNGIAGILPRLMNSRHVLQSAWNKERF